MIIENIKTGQRFEVADGTNYPTHAYRVVTPEAASEIPTPPSVVTTPIKPTAKKSASKKKPAKKKTKKSKK